MASRLPFWSSGGVSVTLEGTRATTGEGAGFFDPGGDIRDLVTIGSSPFSWSTRLGAGVQAIAWGSLIANAGGSAQLAGTLTLMLVPGPGSLAMFAAAAAVAQRRRRV